MYSYLEGLKEYWNDLLIAKTIELHIGDRPSGNLNVLAHEIDLDSVFYNLVNNSVEAFLKPSGPTTREISIRATAVGQGWAQVDYQDNGPGLSSEFNVPDDIFQFGMTSKKDDGLGDSGGTGIGMWLLRNVVDDYRGQIDLRSELGSPGFNISVRLPAHQSKVEGAHG